MLTKFVQYYGKDEAPPEQIELRAGKLTMQYEQGDLRYISLGKSEILRRIYIAIRDKYWGTVAPAYSNIQMDLSDDSFLITYDVENKQDDIDFAWKGTIRGEPAGVVTFSMDGVARSSFWRNRIGFCVLHPADLAGSECRVEHINGQIEEAAFPVDVVSTQPVLPFADLKCISHKVLPGIWADVEFSGDIFETEDQRNWTDASYKTFSTPLRLPYPVEVKEGTRISQTITIRIRETEPGAVRQVSGDLSTGASEPVLSVDRTAKEIPLPKLGLCMSSLDVELNPQEIARLQALHLHHLRVDLRLSDPAYLKNLTLATKQAGELGIPLEVGLLVAENADEELAKLRKEIDELHPPICTWLCYPAREQFLGGSPTENVIRAARQKLEDYDPSALFCGGTNCDLIYLKRTVPPLDQIQKVCFAINPQTHAVDNASMVETVTVQGAVVESARRVAKNLPVMVTPVTLKPRFNPTAPWMALAERPGQLPPPVDIRQMSLIGSGWTVGSFKYLAEAGTDSITYFETAGWRGVMESAQGSPQPELFPSIPGSVYPLYHVFADIGEFAGGAVLPVSASHPLRANGFILRKGNKERMILASYSARPQHIRVDNLSANLTVRFLDEDNMLQAVKNPEEYRHAQGKNLQAENGTLALTLPPYAVVMIEGELS